MGQTNSRTDVSSVENRSVRNAVLALLLLVPAPSLGTMMGMVVFPGSFVGQGIYGFSKVWILAFPLVWLLLVDRGRLSYSPTRWRHLLPGALLGAAIAAMIFGAYVWIGDRLIDAEMLRGKLTEIGLDDKGRYLVLVVYLTVVNSLLEEYVWRWFVFRKCEAVVGGRWAVVLSALFFTIHHVIALSVQMSVGATTLCSVGVFVGGAAWSWCYLRYRSIWPGYVSHAIVDAVIFAVGWRIIFGG